MPVYNRVTLSPQKIMRIESQQYKILEALKLGPRTTTFLATLSKDHGRCIRALREDGYNIRCDDGDPDGDDVAVYTYLPDVRDPEWLVTGIVTSADGKHRFQQTITVEAIDIGKAKNRSQHLFTTVEILDARPKVTPVIKPVSNFFGQPRSRRK